MDRRHQASRADHVSRRNTSRGLFDFSFEYPVERGPDFGRRSLSGLSFAKRRREIEDSDSYADRVKRIRSLRSDSAVSRGGGLLAVPFDLVTGRDVLAVPADA